MIPLNAKVKKGWLWTLFSRNERKRRMRIQENLSLGGKRLLILLECDGSRFLIGCGPDAVNCMLPIPALNAGFSGASLRASQQVREHLNGRIGEAGLPE
jgi:hypothetical protein